MARNFIENYDNESLGVRINTISASISGGIIMFVLIFCCDEKTYQFAYFLFLSFTRW